MHKRCWPDNQESKEKRNTLASRKALLIQKKKKSNSKDTTYTHDIATVTENLATHRNTGSH